MKKNFLIREGDDRGIKKFYSVLNNLETKLEYKNELLTARNNEIYLVVISCMYDGKNVSQMSLLLDKVKDEGGLLKDNFILINLFSDGY